jgi:hypothetical protein
MPLKPKHLFVATYHDRKYEIAARSSAVGLQQVLGRRSHLLEKYRLTNRSIGFVRTRFMTFPNE